MVIEDFLEYRTYAYNRAKHPDLVPENFRAIFPDEKIEKYEAKYQNEVEYWKKFVSDEPRREMESFLGGETEGEEDENN